MADTTDPVDTTAPVDTTTPVDTTDPADMTAPADTTDPARVTSSAGPDLEAERAARDEAFMRVALDEARAAGDAGDVPIGAVVVRDGVVVGRGRNRREVDADPTAHAEIVALKEAARAGGGWRLLGATVYATLEPCPMCAGALVNARVERVVYACPDPKAGAVDTLFAIGRDPRLNHRFQVVSGVLADEGATLLRDFFSQRRARRALPRR